MISSIISSYLPKTELQLIYPAVPPTKRPPTVPPAVEETANAGKAAAATPAVDKIKHNN